MLESFQRQVLNRLPHLDAGGTVVNATPLVDMTDVMKECARFEYGVDLSNRRVRVFGKSEANILGGSVKARPAVQILQAAIKSGELRSGMAVFEATSGNFGIALGLLSSLGVKVIALVSRKLQEGVLEELEERGVMTVNLDVEICPAPGMKIDPNLLVAKVATSNLRERLSELGFDTKRFDEHAAEIERLLARQDVINLAKLLAEAYDAFCPQQYDNLENLEAHIKITGPEIDQQLKAYGTTLAQARVVCAFGTGGTSGGLARYIQARYEGRKAVHVVFPPDGQDVAGIRVRGNAEGLRFYEPELYAGQHEVDFSSAKRLMSFMRGKGYDIGESGALALFAVIQMSNFGIDGEFVVILADGAKKYKNDLVALEQEAEEGFEVNLPQAQAQANSSRYARVLWTHTGYAPNEEGVRFIADALGIDGKDVSIASARDVIDLISRQQIPQGLRGLVEPDSRGKRVLLVCMAGNTSLLAARVLSEKGIKAQSLTGGISRLAAAKGRQLPKLLRQAS